MAEKNIPFNQLGKAGYNRGINRSWVNTIKRNFHEDMVQPAIVSFRDGKYWIIDHQHQTQAIYELNGCDPNTPIRCDVREGLTYEQEAELYYRLNTGLRRLSFSDELVGLIEAKDETALRLRDLVESCGYTIGNNTNASLRACGLAWKIFNGSDGDERLRNILTLTQACWPNNVNGVHTHIINGVSLFLYHHGDEFDRKHFIKTLGPVDPREIVRKGTTYYKQMDSKAFTQPYCTYSVLVNHYNTGLRSKKLALVAPGF